VTGWIVKSWKKVEWRKNKGCKEGRKCKKGRRVFIYVREVAVKDTIDVQTQKCRLSAMCC
jgi:hypothetical protein